MNKHELAKHLARRSRQSRGHAADKLDALVYKLWKESRDPKTGSKEGDLPVVSSAPVKKP